MTAQPMQRSEPVAAPRPHRPAAVKALVGMILLQGVGGVVGGVGLTADPSGRVFDYPVSWLEGTPFHDFLVPALILGLLLGIAPLVDVYGLIRRPQWRWTDSWNGWTGQHWAWTGSIIIGVCLIAWIVVEALIVPDHSIAASTLQAFFGLLGVAIVVVGASRTVRCYYRRPP